MKIIQICPRCGLPGVKVNEKAVSYNLKKSAKAKRDVKLKWNACINPDCKCSYFSKGKEFTKTDLVKPLFYKDKSDNAPICYCSDLTRGEIKSAVKKGCKTIREVRKFTKKNITGHCEERNPLGKCCNQVFLRSVKK
jgi:bacterioferritin-associated ferredoxin